MLSVEEAVIDGRPLLCLLIEGEHLDEGEASHDLHHVALIVDRLASTTTTSLIPPHVRLQVRSGVGDKILAGLLVVFSGRALDDFMADSQRPVWRHRNVVGVFLSGTRVDDHGFTLFYGRWLIDSHLLLLLITSLLGGCRGCT